MKAHVAWGAACAAAVCLAACGGDMNAREIWGKGLVSWGLRPLYPMRENVYLGDIYLYVDDPCDSKDVSSVPQTMLLGTLPEHDVQRAFEQFYGFRPSFPRTERPPAPTASRPKPLVPAANRAAAATTPATQSDAGSADSPQDSPEANARNPIFATRERRFARLPMAAFPDVKLYDYVGATGGGAYGWISAAIGGERSSKIIVSVHQVEMTELPAAVFYRLVDKYEQSLEWQRIKADAATLEWNLKKEVTEAPGCKLKAKTNPSQFMFVNSVFYTRQMSFEFGEDSSLAAKIAATLPTTAASTLPATPFNPPSPPAAPDTGNPAQTSALAMLANLQKMSGGPGAGITFAMGRSGNLALIQTFARPMAFATQHAIWECLPQADDKSGKGPPDCPHPPGRVSTLAK